MGAGALVPAIHREEVRNKTQVGAGAWFRPSIKFMIPRGDRPLQPRSGQLRLGSHRIRLLIELWLDKRLNIEGTSPAAAGRRRATRKARSRKRRRTSATISPDSAE